MGIFFRNLFIVGGIALAMNAEARDTYNFNSGWRIEKQKNLE